MKPCRWAGAPCPFEAVQTVALTGVGVRDLCAAHLSLARELGMHFREVDPNAFIPEWRKRSLQRDMTRAFGAR